MAEDETTLQAIHRLMEEIDEARGQVKVVRDQVQDVLLQNDDYRSLADELKELTVKRGEAKKLLQADKDYQTAAGELDELKFKLKDLYEILSHHLVNYYNETKNTQIKDQTGEVRTVILSAKIGKPELTPDVD